jgi:hypothetical protein
MDLATSKLTTNISIPFSHCDNEEYYLYGWEKLREINPSFTLITPQDHKEYCGDDLSAEEKHFTNSKIAILSEELAYSLI